MLFTVRLIAQLSGFPIFSIFGQDVFTSSPYLFIVRYRRGKWKKVVCVAEQFVSIQEKSICAKACLFN